MGMLIDGNWRKDADRFMQNGSFQRELSPLRGGSAQQIAKGLRDRTRSCLIVSHSCPWSHRTLLVRALKGIADIKIVFAGGPRTEGYALLGQDILGPSGEHVRHVHQLYVFTDPNYTGRATVPVLWDADSCQIVSNDSSVIARALDHIGRGWRLVPVAKTKEIDALNKRIYNGLSNAVYRAGFATTQSAYAEAVSDVFATLNWLERRLQNSRCLLGTVVSEADLFLFASLVRFDAVYSPLFRCTKKRLVDYPALWAYARDVFLWPGVADTIDFEANLKGYFLNDTENNPHGIVPVLPSTDWNEPHLRERLGALTALIGDKNVPFKCRTDVFDEC